MNESSSIDSNIILYALDEEDSPKKLISLELIRENPYLSSQSLSEVVNVCRKRWKYKKDKLVLVGEFLLNNCYIIPVDSSIVAQAHYLIKRYDFQYFDALITSCSLHKNCAVLYSEDMQHGLTVENQLTILNPFL